MKKLIAVLMVLSAVNIKAERCEEKTQEPRVITYTVTLCKQDDTDPALWQKMVEDAQNVAKTQDASKRMEQISKMVHATKHAPEQILMDIQVQTADGVCRCTSRGACNCYHTYKGVCPCATIRQKSCNNQASCCS